MPSLSHAAHSPLERRWLDRPAMPLLLAAAGLGYALVPSAAHAVVGPGNPASYPARTAGALALLFVTPVAGALLVHGSAAEEDPSALRRRGLGMLLVLAPTLWVMCSTLPAAVGLPRSSQWILWNLLWLLAVAGLWWWSGAGARVLPSRTRTLARRLHATLAICLLLFVPVHLVVNLTALDGLPAYNSAAAAFRTVWRTPLVEPLLLAVLFTQVATGLALALDAARGRATPERLAQVTAGLVLATFLVSHTCAVAVLGRAVLDEGPAFTFASGGPAGLFGGAQSIALLPYYGLAVLAFAVHLARPARLALTRRTNPSAARAVTAAVVLAGACVAVALIAALVRPGP